MKEENGYEISRGVLNLEKNNTYSLYLKSGDEFTNINEELDKYRNSEVQIIIRNNHNEQIFSARGCISSRKPFKDSQKLYDIFIGTKVVMYSNEELNVIEDNDKNLTQFLFEKVGQYIKLGIKELKKIKDSELDNKELTNDTNDEREGIK